MASSPPPPTDPDSYSGPTPQELGSLADWVSLPEPARTPDAAPFLQPHVSFRAAPPTRLDVPEDYCGPSRQELGALARWVDDAEGLTADDLSAPSRPASLELGSDSAWDSDWIEPWESRDPEFEPRPGSSGKRGVFDDFLRQLDEVELSLRKRAPTDGPC